MSGDPTSQSTTLIAVPGVEDAVEIGRGGFATVFRAQQPHLGRQVAVKVLDKAPDDDLLRRRFARECKALGRLSAHPNIVTLFEAGWTLDGKPFLITECCEAGSLQQRLDREGPLPWREAVALAIRLAGALGAAHRAGVLHCDIKPANVLIGDDGEPRLVDFGIARLTELAQGDSTNSPSATPRYAPPEVFDDAPPAVTRDVYSLAATLHALISGEPPIAGGETDSVWALLDRIRRDPPASLLGFGAPAPVCAVIERALAKNPAWRQPDIDAFVADLAQAAGLAPDAGGQGSPAGTAAPLGRAALLGAVAPAGAGTPAAGTPGAGGAATGTAGRRSRSLLAALHDAAPARRRGRIFGAGALAVAATLGLGGVGLTELRAHPTGSLATMAGPATAPSPPGGGLPEPSEPAPAPPEATTSTTAAPTTTAAPLPSTTLPKPRSPRKPAPPPASHVSPPPTPPPAPVPTPLVTLTNLSGRVSAVAWSPDGGSLATVDPSGVTLWNPVNGSRLGAPIDASLGPITAVAWRPDGAGLAAASGATVALTSTDGARREQLDTGGPALTALAFRPGGDELATLAGDGAFSVWRLPKGPSRSFAGIEAPGERPTALGWSADGKLLAAARKGGVTVWDATPGGGSARAALAGDAAVLNAVAWRPDGSQVAAVGGGAVQVWDPATGASLRRFPVSHKEPRQLAWRADGRVLAVAGTDAVVSLWDPATGAHRGDLPAGAADDTAGVALSWSPAGDRVAVTMGHQTVIYAIRADGTPA